MGRTSTQERVFGLVGQAGRKMDVEEIFRAMGGKVTLSGVRSAIAGLNAGTGWAADQAVLDPAFVELLAWVRGFLPAVSADAGTGGREDLISAVRAAREAALAKPVATKKQ